MAFYDLDKRDRDRLVSTIQSAIVADLHAGTRADTLSYFSDEDTYIRKAGYLSVGRVYTTYPALRPKILDLLESLWPDEDFRVRQTVLNAAGEIGKTDFQSVRHFFDRGLFDPHHSPRNAVIGSVKKMGEVNPGPVLDWARQYLHHEDKEIRREICHGIELRGRTHPEDILPLLRELQHDRTARVRNTLVHVLGQIAYKKGCLAIVAAHLKTWDNPALVADALVEIIDVHERYKNFAVLTVEAAREYIEIEFGG